MHLIEPAQLVGDAVHAVEAGLISRATVLLLAAAMDKMLGDDLSVEVERVDAIPHEPGGKVRTVVSHCRDRGT